MLNRFVKTLAFTLAAAVSLPGIAVAGSPSTIGVAPLNNGSTNLGSTKVLRRAGVTIRSSTTAGICFNVSVAPLNFGLIVPGRDGVTIKSSTTISVSCSKGTRFALLLNENENSTANSGNGRRLFPGTAGGLAYDLFQDSARTMPWGDGSNGGGINGFGDGAVQQFPVYASFYVRPTAPVGSHSDSLTVTLSIF